MCHHLKSVHVKSNSANQHTLGFHMHWHKTTELWPSFYTTGASGLKRQIVEIPGEHHYYCVQTFLNVSLIKVL